MQIVKIARLQAPFDFGIARQRARPRAGNIGKHAVELTLHRETERVGLNDRDVFRMHPLAQEIGPMAMQFGGDDFSRGVVRRKHRSLSAGSGAAVQQPRAGAHEQPQPAASLRPGS